MEKHENKTALERLVKEHKLIKENFYPNRNKLSEICEVSTKTIMEDLNFLKDRFNAPLEYDYFHKGYHYTEPFELSILNKLSSNDIETLISAKMLLSCFNNTPFYNQLCSVLNFLTDDNLSSNMLKRVTTPPTSKAIINDQVWNTIYDSMKDNSVIEFDYNGLHRGELDHRRVHAYQLVLQDSLIYLFGYAEERKAERLFNLARISNITKTADKFTLPDNYNFNDRCGGGRFGAFFSSNTKTYKVRAYGFARQTLNERIWANDQVITDFSKLGYAEMTFSATQEEAVMHWILSQGSDLEPLAPEEFRNKWKNRVKSMVKRIGKD